MNADESSKGIASWRVKAGRRNYFFDVKVTRGKDLFMSITESRKVNGSEEEPRYEKQKIYLYKEDFDNFFDGFENALLYIRENQGLNGFRSADSVRKIQEMEDE